MILEPSGDRGPRHARTGRRDERGAGTALMLAVALTAWAVTFAGLVRSLIRPIAP